jgi:hypothetical protein
MMLTQFEHIIEKLARDGEQSSRPRFDFRMRVRRFIRSLSFDAKKKLLEAIISPETGGSCIVKYKGHDAYDSDEKKVVEINFNADIDKIRAVISGVDKRSLLNKFDEGGTSLANVDGCNDQVLAPLVLHI